MYRIVFLFTPKNRRFYTISIPAKFINSIDELTDLLSVKRLLLEHYELDIEEEGILASNTVITACIIKFELMDKLFILTDNDGCGSEDGMIGYVACYNAVIKALSEQTFELKIN